MTVVALVFAALAALLHVYIFVLESVLWTTPRARNTFGTTAEEAQATRQLAYNQGFYNLFLAVLAIVGVVVVAAGGNASKRRAASTQGAFPLLALLSLGVAALV